MTHIEVVLSNALASVEIALANALSPITFTMPDAMIPVIYVMPWVTDTMEIWITDDGIAWGGIT